MSYRLIDGRKLSAQTLSELALGISDIKVKTGLSPGLSLISVGDDPASNIYVRTKERTAASVGIFAKAPSSELNCYSMRLSPLLEVIWPVDTYFITPIPCYPPCPIHLVTRQQCHPAGGCEASNAHISKL